MLPHQKLERQSSRAMAEGRDGRRHQRWARARGRQRHRDGSGADVARERLIVLIATIQPRRRRPRDCSSVPADHLTISPARRRGHRRRGAGLDGTAESILAALVHVTSELLFIGNSARLLTEPQRAKRARKRRRLLPR